MLTHGAEEIATVCLEFGEAGLDHMALLSMIEVRAASPDPLLGFQQEICELRADLLRQVFQQGHAEEQINLNIFLKLGLLKAGLEKIGELSFPGRALGGTRGFPIGLAAWNLPTAWLQTVVLCKKRETGGLPDEFKQVSLGCLHESRAQEDIMMDVIHSDRESSERKLR
jgi:hypothetical protein